MTKQKAVVEFTEQTMAWFNSLVRWVKDHDRDWHEGDDVAALTICTLIHQQKRTVSREWVKEWAKEMLGAGMIIEGRKIPPDIEQTEKRLMRRLSELGYAVENDNAQ